jgi:cytidine deaminase
MNKYLELAKQIALKESNHKHYLFGAVGIRRDGKIVISKNIVNCGHEVNCHAESRLAKKLDIGSKVYVVRISKDGKNYRLAKPCLGCQHKLKSVGVTTVYFSIDNNSWGVIEF